MSTRKKNKRTATLFAALLVVNVLTWCLLTLELAYKSWPVELEFNIGEDGTYNNDSMSIALTMELLAFIALLTTTVLLAALILLHLRALMNSHFE